MKAERYIVGLKLTQPQLAHSRPVDQENEVLLFTNAGMPLELGGKEPEPFYLFPNLGDYKPMSVYYRIELYSATADVRQFFLQHGHRVRLRVRAVTLPLGSIHQENFAMIRL